MCGNREPHELRHQSLLKIDRDQIIESTWQAYQSEVSVRGYLVKQREHPTFLRTTSSSNLLEEGGIFLIVLGRESRRGVARIARCACIVTTS